MLGFKSAGYGFFQPYKKGNAPVGNLVVIIPFPVGNEGGRPVYGSGEDGSPLAPYGMFCGLVSSCCRLPDD